MADVRPRLEFGLGREEASYGGEFAALDGSQELAGNTAGHGSLEASPATGLFLCSVPQCVLQA